MERLTKSDERGFLLTYLNDDTGLPNIITKGNPYYKVIEGLKAYEDTGLEPGEIPILLDRLKRANEQWNIWCEAYQKDVSVWIPVAERLPSIFEYSGCEECEKYYREFEIAVQTDTLEYYFGYFDGYKWFDKCHRRFNGDVVAWKVHQPFSPQN